jgi:purine-binding chemotaxis protein CheW
MALRELTSLDVTDAELERVRVPEARKEDQLRPLFLFKVEGTWLAIDASLAEAVLDDVGSSPVPGAPPHIPGVVTHGDHVLALLDIARFCGLGEGRSAAGFSRTVVVSAGPMRVGVRAEGSAGVVEVPMGSVHAPQALQGERLLPHLLGECETPWGVCGILDVPKLLEAARVRG